MIQLLGMIFVELKYVKYSYVYGVLIQVSEKNYLIKKLVKNVMKEG